jgi:putative FmdB family regulatory protein
MPTYEFKCPKCFRLEEQYFGFKDEHKLLCPGCKTEMGKVIGAAPAIFHGGGWGGKP